jgi:hypothetical protein
MITPTGNKVAEFYDKNTDKFLEVYGEVIHAYRTNDVSIYLDYTIQNAELADGQKILNAGFVLGGLASYSASKLDLQLEGVAVSEV